MSVTFGDRELSTVPSNHDPDQFSESWEDCTGSSVSPRSSHIFFSTLSVILHPHSAFLQIFECDTSHQLHLHQSMPPILHVRRRLGNSPTIMHAWVLCSKPRRYPYLRRLMKCGSREAGECCWHPSCCWVKGTLTNQLLNVVGKRDGPDVHLKVWAFSATG